MITADGCFGAIDGSTGLVHTACESGLLLLRQYVLDSESTWHTCQIKIIKLGDPAPLQWWYVSSMINETMMAVYMPAIQYVTDAIPIP